MIRWISVLALCTAVVLLPAGCKKAAEEPVEPQANETAESASPEPAKKGTIGVSLLTMANPFFTEMAEAMKSEAGKHGYEVVVTAGENDPARQKDQVNDFIVRKVNAIILCPCDSRSIATSIVAANKAGIPVFTADIACLDKSAKVVSHVATDNYAGGKLAAEGMVEMLAGKGKVAIIDHPEVESVILRTKGFREVIDGKPGIQVVAQLPGGGARDASFKTAQDILEKHPDLDAFFAINDPSALGAVAAIEKAGKAGKVRVIGFDGMPEARQAIKAGKIYADAIQYPDKIGAMAVQAVLSYMAGETPKPEVLIPTGLYRQADAQKDPALK